MIALFITVLSSGLKQIKYAHRLVSQGQYGAPSKLLILGRQPSHRNW